MSPALVSDQQSQYICPGESHPISRAVHLARLTAFYPACRTCPFRHDTDLLPAQTAKALQETEHRAISPELFHDDGVRGVYLNALGPREVENIAAALAAVLWKQTPLRCGSGPGEPETTVAEAVLPAVVLGYDDRPTAAALALVAAEALRKMSCQVIDIGQTSRPGFWHAAHHLQSAAGVFITGSGCGPAWQGMEFVSREAQPLSRGPAPSAETFSLDDITAEVRDPYQRPTRHGGRQRSFPAQAGYVASLQRHFHALRPLTVCVGCSSPLILRTLTGLFANLPVQLLPISLPVRPRDVQQKHDPDVQRLSQAVVNEQADFGLLIDDDGQRCAFVADDGNLLPTTVTTSILADIGRQEHPGALLLLEEDRNTRLHDLLSQRGFRLQHTPAGSATVSSTMRETHASFAGGVSGRFWFREAFPTSDAILTLAKMLTAMSQHDHPLSRFSQRHV